MFDLCKLYAKSQVWQQIRQMSSYNKADTQISKMITQQPELEKAISYTRRNATTPVHYNILVKKILAAGKGQLALSMFNEMRKRGVSPTEGTYVTLFSGLGASAIKGSDISAQVRKLFNTSPFSTLHSMQNAYIYYLAQTGQMKEAIQALHTMVDPDIYAHVLVFRGVYDDFNEEGLAAVKQLWQDIERPSHPLHHQINSEIIGAYLGVARKSKNKNLMAHGIDYAAAVFGLEPHKASPLKRQLQVDYVTFQTMLIASLRLRIGDRVLAWVKQMPIDDRKRLLQGRNGAIFCSFGKACQTYYESLSDENRLVKPYFEFDAKQAKEERKQYHKQLYQQGQKRKLGKSAYRNPVKRYSLLSEHELKVDEAVYK